MLAMPAQRADSSIQSSSRWPMPRRRWEGRTASSTRCARSSPNSMIAKPVRAPRDVPLLPLSQATTASVSRSRMARSTRAASYFHPSPASMKSRDIIPIAWASRGSASRMVIARGGVIAAIVPLSRAPGVDDLRYRKLQASLRRDDQGYLLCHGRKEYSPSGEEIHHASERDPEGQGQPARQCRARGPRGGGGQHHGEGEPRLAGGDGAGAHGRHA